MKTLTLPMKKMTACQLVQYWYGHSRMCQAAVESALVGMTWRGWLTSFIPRPYEWERPMVFVSQRHEFAAILRCLDQTGVGVVPRGLIESRTNDSVEGTASGFILSSFGIGITKIEGNNVFIRGTTVGFAMMTCQVRSCIFEPQPMEMLIHSATGKQVSRPFWNDDLRLQTALAFDEFEIDVPGVLNGDAESEVRSRWVVAASPPPPFGPPSGHCDPPSFPEPDPSDIDPNIPPF